MKYNLVELEKMDERGTTMKTHLEAGRVQVGNVVTLKKEEGAWIVKEVFKSEVDEKFLNRKKWENDI